MTACCSTSTFTGGGGTSSSSALSVPALRPPRRGWVLPVARPAYVASCAAQAGGRNFGGDLHRRRTGREGKHQHERREEHQRHVQCEVEVVSWRERRIRGSILVAADADSVWGVLTDYERLADFIPNLVCSRTIPCPHQGRVWLEQRGLQRALYWHIEARVLLDLKELPHLANGHELHFSMVDGDFKKFEGKWSVKSGLRSSTTILSYEVNVIPRFNFPAIFIERIIRSDLPVNLQALAWRAEKFYQGNQNILLSGSTTSSKDVFWTGSPFPSGAKETSCGSSFSTLITSPSSDFASNWGVFGKFCSLDRPCIVDEVHLRKFDGLLENGGAHRCVVATITVKAHVREVWNVLTAYESLPEIVPNLAISRILLRDNNKVRILQEGCKGLLYMVLHARVVLDLHEICEQEISFEQVEGDFDSFGGKWVLEPLGNDHTVLKYAVESKLHKDTFLSEAIVEEVIYEDLPSNLCAIRDFIEKRENVSQKITLPIFMKNPNKAATPAGTMTCADNKKQADTPLSASDENQPKQKPKVPGLQRDIDVLKAELLSFISKHGQEGFMPMRKQLRLHGRIDIEKAITRNGGFRKIANLMNLSLAYKHRKPKGYWDNLENLREEISRFQRNWGMDPNYMPSRKSFERAGRYDIARALEKWGGLQEVSRLLSLELRHPRRQPTTSTTQKKLGSVTSEGADTREKANSPCVSQDTHKWLMKLKDLDINWVE
ncbi:hypothetical protein Taro_005084 [Colocasia esculenta]|uniref:Coenzyme Q-binding protein COQ10 START domain-containing protein n=1 Tax=Colocasia esculenta TaxID=4460 RepID=A0A843TNX7_COLES|nr:hypothetical protein [Colocasia esculenta]